MKLITAVLATTFQEVLYSAFDPETPLFFVVWPLAIGLFLALIVGYLMKRINGYLVRALLKAEAFTPESAQNLADLGCNNFYFRWLLRDAGTLRRLIFASAAETAENPTESGEESGEAPPIRYYIPEETRYRAGRFYELERGMELMLPLAAIALFAVVLFCFYMFPKMG